VPGRKGVGAGQSGGRTVLADWLRCRERPWLAGSELTLAVWLDLYFAHRDEPTHAGRSERRHAERTWTTFRYLAEYIVNDRPRESGRASRTRNEFRLTFGRRPEIRVAVDLGSGSLSRLRIRTRNIGLGSARPVPG
jgi:hypothetical protein